MDSIDDQLEIDKGRSYQCVFCKRGFTTAQALGGHMNIHRKDRAKTSTSRPPPSTTKQEESNNFTGRPQFYHPYTPWYAAAQEAQIHYRTFFPAPTSSIHDQNSLRTIPFGEDCCMSLSLQFGTAKFGEEMEEKRRSECEDDDDDDGSLDLELRLGHDP